MTGLQKAARKGKWPGRPYSLVNEGLRESSGTGVSMTDEEKERIRAFGSALEAEIHLACSASGAGRGVAIADFCLELERLVPSIRIDEADSEPGDPPGIFIGDGLRFHGVPSGGELEGFLEAVAWAAGLRRDSEPSLEATLRDIALPADIRMYVTSQCPFCPAVLRSLVPLPFLNPRLHLRVIEGDRYPEMAAADGVKSVPTVILDDRFRWTGSVKRDEILALLLERDPATLGADSLAGMLAEGRAAEVASFMLQARAISPAFVELLIHEKWPLRLAAMVAAEEVAEADPNLVVDIVEALWERFEALDAARQGDILYLFGEMEAMDAIPGLKAVLLGTYPDEVKEAAQEAMEQLAKAPAAG